MEKMLRTLWALTLLVLIGVLSAIVVEACSPAADRQAARTVVDVALAACVLEHPDMTEQELYAICHWAEEIAPIVKELIASQRKGLARMQPKAQPAADAGANDGGK